MVLTSESIQQFQAHIFDWWKTNRRDLPWRHTHDPYKILVSEVMLQQTQVQRVLPKYSEFINVFPTVTELAKASPAAVLRIWKGLGYNRRALYLLKTAQEVVNAYKGAFPDYEEQLVKLPGLGTYTARALLVFAFRKNISMVDTNIRQIITHHFFGDVPQKPKVIQEVADSLVPAGKSWEWHQALMDYGTVHNTTFDIKKKISAKPKIIFRDSDRFFRGKIIDALRSGSMNERKLCDDFKHTYAKPDSFTRNLVRSLMKEGMVAKRGARIFLPE